jgi:O-antigen/teichoic acid export membrane protein
MSNYLSRMLSNIGNDIFQGLKWQYILNIGTGVAMAFYVIALGKILGPDDFGVYAICAAVPAVIAALMDCRFQEVTIFLFENSEEREKKSIIASLLTFDLLLKIFYIPLAILVALALSAIGYSAIDPYLSLLFGSMLFLSKTFSSVCMGMLRCAGKLSIFAIIQGLDWGTRILAILFLTSDHLATIENIILSQIIVGGSFNALLIFLTVRAFDASYFKIGKLRSTFRFAHESRSIIFGSQAISAMDVVVKELDVLICGAFLTVGDVGIYKVSKSFAGMAWRFADPVYIVMMPRLTRLFAAKEFDQLDIFTRDISKLLALFACILFVTSLIFVEFMVPQFFGNEYEKAVELYPYSSAWILFALPFIWTHSMAMATGRPAIQFRAGLVGNGLGLLAILAGVYFGGLAGAAAGLSLAFCLPFITSFFLLRKAGLVRW